MSKKNTMEYVWENIDKRTDNDCWNWMGYKDIGNYGKININNKTYYAHRFIYEQTFGKILGGSFILHKCNNPSCCNPKHLYSGTQKDNIKQMYNDKRNVNHCGEKSGSTKLTEKDVLEIRELYLTKKYYQRDLGEIFGVHRYTITGIVNKKRWKHL